MIESPFYEIIEERGLLEGWKEGWRRAWQEGWEEGYREGLAESLRAWLIEVFAVRVGPVPVHVSERITKETDPEKLRRWFRAVLKCHSVAEVEKALTD